MRLVNIGGHGLGDCILSLQISYLLNQKNIPHKNLISTRNDVYKPLWYIFGNEFELKQIDEKYANDNALLKDDLILNEVKNKYGSDITYNVPDLLFKHPLAFKYEDYGLNPQLIKKTKTLTKHFSKKENIIYCGLCSTTEGYVYNDIPGLLKSIAEYLPQYIIYFPMIKSWDKKIDNLGDFSINFPPNVFIHEDPSFEDSLDYLTKSVYGVFTCNGPSHIAYQLGLPRLVLDPQYGRIPWMIRWKEDFEECLPIYLDKESIAKVVYNNITIPQTTMIDRKILLDLINKGYNNWKDIFYFKF
jgi:hypothetical protein